MSMQTATWSPQLALGLGEMDRAHQHLLDRLDELASLPDAQFYAAMSALTAAIEADFRAEEELMEQIAFPDLHQHREQHARVLSALHHADPQVAQGDIAAGRHCIELLPQWFLLHLASMDQALARALKAAANARQADAGAARAGQRVELGAAEPERAP
jgi:hemerythrin